MKWVIKGYEQISLLLPSLSHRQHISLWHIKGRGVAIRIGSVLKQHRVLTGNLEENHANVCAYSFSDPLWRILGGREVQWGKRDNINFREPPNTAQLKNLLHIHYTYIRWLLVNDSTIEACSLRVECQHQLRK